MADRMALPPFSVTLTGAEDAVRDGLAQTMTCLIPLALNLSDSGTVELVLAEALNNVVEHALSANDHQTMIEIRGCYGAEGLHLAIIDRGTPMPRDRMPRAKAPDIDVATVDLPEGGFGWFMIHSLARDVGYARVGDRNHLTLLISVGS